MENILSEEYNRYFQKSPTAWTVRSRGKKLLSENIDFKFDENNIINSEEVKTI